MNRREWIEDMRNTIHLLSAEQEPEKQEKKAKTMSDALKRHGTSFHFNPIAAASHRIVSKPIGA